MLQIRKESRRPGQPFGKPAEGLAPIGGRLNGGPEVCFMEVPQGKVRGCSAQFPKGMAQLIFWAVSNEFSEHPLGGDPPRPALIDSATRSTAGTYRALRSQCTGDPKRLSI